VPIDLGPSEQSAVDFVPPLIRGVAELGLPVTSPIRCMTLEDQAAQKLHACTNPRVLEMENRARDILDIVLIDLLGQLDAKKTQISCIRVFEQRGVHSWPPQSEIPPAWKVELAALAVTQALPFASSDEIIAAFMKIFTEIVGA